MSGPPARPGRWESRLSWWVFRSLAPPLARPRTPAAPERLGPSEVVDIPRADGSGRLAATLFPVAEPRGVVLLFPPWLKWGRTYFHRHGRLEALREAGYTAVIVDFPGFGGTARSGGYYWRAVEDAMTWLEATYPGLPRHYWGVSSGGYWAHFVLSRRSGFTSAVFEDVAAHLLDWSSRIVPRGRPFYRLFRRLFPNAHRHLDARFHAPHLRVDRVAYVSGANDPGVLPDDTTALATAAGGRALIVADAEHLEGIKVAGADVLALALRTFAGN